MTTTHFKVSAYIYDMYAKIRQGKTFTIAELDKYHCLSRNGIQSILVEMNLVEKKDGLYKWLGDDPDDKLVQKVVQRFQDINRQNNDKYRQKNESVNTLVEAAVEEFRQKLLNQIVNNQTSQQGNAAQKLWA